jgi:hypothetical protein
MASTQQTLARRARIPAQVSWILLAVAAWLQANGEGDVYTDAVEGTDPDDLAVPRWVTSKPTFR